MSKTIEELQEENRILQQKLIDSYDKETILKLQQEIYHLKIQKSNKIDELSELEETVEEKEQELNYRIKGTIFKCSACGYVSTKKANVIKHFEERKVVVVVTKKSSKFQ